MMDSSDNPTFDQSFNFVDLCDDVLRKIFSYLDLYDGAIVIPSTCKRLRNFICENNFSFGAIASDEFVNTKWPSKNIQYGKVFEKVGLHIKKFTFNSSENEFESKLILKSLSRYCHQLNTMEITTLLHVANMKLLPTSLRKLTIGDFGGRSLDISALVHLEILRLASSHLPDQIKVQHRLKEFNLILFFDNQTLVNADQINRLTTMISDKYTVQLHVIYGFNHTPDLNQFNQISNLTYSGVRFNSGVGIAGVDLSKIIGMDIYCSCRAYNPWTIDQLTNFVQRFCYNDSTSVLYYRKGQLIIIRIEYENHEIRSRYLKPSLTCKSQDCKYVHICLYLA